MVAFVKITHSCPYFFLSVNYMLILFSKIELTYKYNRGPCQK